LVKNLAPFGTAGRLLIKGEIRLPKVDHTKYEVHLMSNKDEYQKSVQLKFTQSCLSLLITCTLAEEIDFDIGYLHTFQTSMTFTLDWVTQHTVVYQSSTSIYTTNFVQNGKTV